MRRQSKYLTITALCQAPKRNNLTTRIAKLKIPLQVSLYIFLECSELAGRRPWSGQPPCRSRPTLSHLDQQPDLS